MYRVTREPRSVANANHYLITYPVRLLNTSCLIVSLYFPIFCTMKLLSKKHLSNWMLSRKTFVSSNMFSISMLLKDMKNMVLKRLLLQLRWFLSQSPLMGCEHTFSKPSIAIIDRYIVSKEYGKRWKLTYHVLVCTVGWYYGTNKGVPLYASRSNDRYRLKEQRLSGSTKGVTWWDNWLYTLNTWKSLLGYIRIDNNAT